MWLTSSSGRICSKDQAAEWAIPKLAKEHATLLEKAKKAYLGDYDDNVESNCSMTRKCSSDRSEFLRFNLFF